MKTKLLTTLLFAMFCLSVNSQTPSLIFANGIGGIGIDDGNAITTDLSGNIYVTGKITDTVDFDPSPAVANLICTGYFSAFVAKYNSAGQYQWAFGLSDYWDKGLGINIDMAGNLYVTGLFADTVDFDPSGATANLISANDMDDIFIAKYNSNGQYQWAINMGSLSYNDGAFAITTDNSGNVYATGYFTDIADFDPSPATASLISNGANDIFVAKYNSTGQYQWAIGMGGGNDEAGNSITIDAAGSVYIAGSFQNTVDFDPSAGTANLVSSGGYDIFAAKYNSSGQYQWAFSIGAGSTLWEEGQGIVADNFGNVYVAGRFQGTNVDFDPSINSATLTSAGPFWEDIFVAKYDTAGQYQWAINMGGTDEEVANAITTDALGNIYITGVFNLTAEFNPGSGSDSLTAAGPDVFVAKYDSNGQYQWAFNAGGSMWDVGHDICTDASGNIYVTGNFSGTADFDPSATTANLTSNGQDDFYIAKYSQNLDGISQTELFLGDIIYPNPFSTQTTLQTDKLLYNATLTIYNLYGQQVRQMGNLSGQTIFFQRENLPSGIYFLRLMQDNKVIATNKVVITDK